MRFVGLGPCRADEKRPNGNRLDGRFEGGVPVLRLDQLFLHRGLHALREQPAFEPLPLDVVPRGGGDGDAQFFILLLEAFGSEVGEFGDQKVVERIGQAEDEFEVAHQRSRARRMTPQALG